VRLFNPRFDNWSVCFDFVLAPDAEVARIVGKNDTGKITVARLGMNAPHAVRARWKWFLTYALEAEFLSD